MVEKVKKTAPNYVEVHSSQNRQINKGMRKNFDANFKLQVTNYARENGTPADQNKFSVSEKKCHFEYQNLEFIQEKINAGFPVTSGANHIKSFSTCSTNEYHKKGIKTSIGWCLRMMQCNGICLRR
ncbi:hypothetical protein PR048_016592 [Dryococelus australis]|uniref:Uncharacterized protein n=1 Tax=Dryococelus australis TaxID=614101 RepID=A0ABQ9H729_9NEOP|nr:hypothetical protein PR048_016592 [Dryococelus australis]